MWWHYEVTRKGLRNQAELKVTALKPEEEKEGGRVLEGSRVRKMKESTKWAWGIGAFLGSTAILWYAVFGLTGMLWWNSEVTSAKSLDPPKPPQIALPNLSSLDIEKALGELRESKKREPVLVHKMEGLAELPDDPRLKTIKCRCGCDIMLAACSCSVALRQIKELGIAKGDTE